MLANMYVLVQMPYVLKKQNVFLLLLYFAPNYSYHVISPYKILKLMEFIWIFFLKGNYFILVTNCIRYHLTETVAELFQIFKSNIYGSK